MSLIFLFCHRIFIIAFTIRYYISSIVDLRLFYEFLYFIL